MGKAKAKTRAPTVPSASAMPPVHARLQARRASDAQAFVTITAFQDSNNMEMDLPDVLVPLRSLANGAIFAVPPLEGKWTAGEVIIRYDSARDVLSLWTPSVTTHSGGAVIRCVPRTVPTHNAAPFVVSSWRDIDSEKAVYVDSIYDPAVGWYGEPVDWWKAHGIGRPLGFRRSVQVEVDDGVAVNEQAAGHRWTHVVL